MKMRIRYLLQKLTLLLGLLSVVSSKGQDAGALYLENEISLPGVEGRIDHFSVDVPGQRLFVAALGNDSVEILDLQQAKRTAEIKGLLEPQGVYYDSTTGRLYIATAGDGKLRVYDGKSLTPQDTIEFGADADNVRYDQETGNIWVGYGDGGIGIVNSTGKKVGSIVLGTHPESFKFEENGDRVYVNVPKQFGVAVIDRKRRATVAKWGLGGSSANYPMALNEADRRLFVGCRRPARLVILETGSGRVVTTLATVGDADDIFYDSDRKLVYVIGGEGAVEVLRQRDPTNYEHVERIKTAPGARTGLFVSAWHRLFVAAPRRGSDSAKVLIYRTGGDKQ
jgi:DNA-binding beta-propeller fold protein YncE